jgi:hypothetical protein
MNYSPAWTQTLIDMHCLLPVLLIANIRATALTSLYVNKVTMMWQFIYELNARTIANVVRSFINSGNILWRGYAWVEK